MIIYLEPDILECEVKWALGSITTNLGSITTNKSSGGDGIPVELFQISNPERWCFESAALNMPENLENTAVATGLERSVFIPIPKKDKAKKCSNYHTIALISHTSNVMLKILQARRLQYVNCELPDVQAGFSKSRGTRDQIANIHWIIKKAREFQENIYSCFIDLHLSLWLCGLQQIVENSERDGNTEPLDVPPEKPVCRSRRNC